jgi:hypothetical protein
MKDVYKRFRSILLIEIEDLHDDLKLFIEVINDRHEHRLITDYVYQENLAILRNEVLGLEDCLHGCPDLESHDVQSVDEVAELIKHDLRDRLSQRGYVPALYALLEKRIDRIAGYLKMDGMAGVQSDRDSIPRAPEPSRS